MSDLAPARAFAKWKRRVLLQDDLLSRDGANTSALRLRVEHSFLLVSHATEGDNLNVNKIDNPRHDTLMNARNLALFWALLEQELKVCRKQFLTCS